MLTRYQEFNAVGERKRSLRLGALAGRYARQSQCDMTRLFVTGALFSALPGPETKRRSLYPEHWHSIRLLLSHPSPSPSFTTMAMNSEDELDSPRAHNASLRSSRFNFDDAFIAVATRIKISARQRIVSKPLHRPFGFGFLLLSQYTASLEDSSLLPPRPLLKCRSLYFYLQCSCLEF